MWNNNGSCSWYTFGARTVRCWLGDSSFWSVLQATERRHHAQLLPVSFYYLCDLHLLPSPSVFHRRHLWSYISLSTRYIWAITYCKSESIGLFTAITLVSPFLPTHLSQKTPWCHRTFLSPSNLPPSTFIWHTWSFSIRCLYHCCCLGKIVACLGAYDLMITTLHYHQTIYKLKTPGWPFSA